MDLYYVKPDITRYVGLKVKEDTNLKFESADKTIKQELKNLELTTLLKRNGEDYETESVIKNHLKVGDILIYSDVKGYQVPSFPLANAKEIKEDFEALMEV